MNSGVEWRKRRVKNKEVGYPAVTRVAWEGPESRRLQSPELPWKSSQCKVWNPGKIGAGCSVTFSHPEGRVYTDPRTREEQNG